MITFDIPLWQVFSLLAGTVLPIFVGLVTKRTTHSGTKATLLAALALVTQLSTELADALQHRTEYNLGTALLAGLATFLIAVAMHYGLWKPTGVTDAAQASLVKAPQQPQEPRSEVKLSNPYSGSDAAAVAEAVAARDRVPGPDHRATTDGKLLE